MRTKMGKYRDGGKHQFEGTCTKCGSYTDKETGRIKRTFLLTGITDERQKKCAAHVWVPENKSISKFGMMKEGKRYSFMARVGTYTRGKSSTEFHLRDVCNIKEVS